MEEQKECARCAELLAENETLRDLLEQALAKKSKPQKTLTSHPQLSSVQGSMLPLAATFPPVTICGEKHPTSPNVRCSMISPHRDSMHVQQLDSGTIVAWDHRIDAQR